MLADPTDGNVQNRGYEKKWGRRITIGSLVYSEPVIFPRLFFVAVAHDDLPEAGEGQLVDSVREQKQPVESPTPPSLKSPRCMRITAAFHQARRNEGQR